MIDVTKLAIGDKISNEVFLMNTCKKSEKGYKITLSNKSGTLENCNCADEFMPPEVVDNIGGAVVIKDAVVLDGLNLSLDVKIKNIENAKTGTYKPSDIFKGISEDTASAMREIIRTNVLRITDENLRNYLRCIVTEEYLDKLSKMPATLAFHGKYRGGALVTTAIVTNMAIQAALQYVKFPNGIYSSFIDFNTLVASSVLMYIGNCEYITSEEPFRKTLKGLDRGYMSICQSILERKLLESGALITEEQISKILNILNVTVSEKTSVRATTVEGAILRHCYKLYSEMDLYDSGMADHEPKEGEDYYYDPKLKRYILSVKEVA